MRVVGFLTLNTQIFGLFSSMKMAKTVDRMKIETFIRGGEKKKGR